MKNKLLSLVLLYESNKNNYSDEEQLKISGRIEKLIADKLNAYYNAINDINDL